MKNVVSSESGFQKVALTKKNSAGIYLILFTLFFVGLLASTNKHFISQDLPIPDGHKKILALMLLIFFWVAFCLPKEYYAAFSAKVSRIISCIPAVVILILLIFS